MKTDDKQAQLASSRQHFEQALSDLQRSLQRELGWAPRTRTWLLPVLGVGAGLALAGWLRRGKRRG